MEDIKTQRLQSMVTLEEVELKFDQQLHSLLLSHHPVSAQQLGRLSTPYTFLNTETISCGLRTAGTKEPILLFGRQALSPMISTRVLCHYYSSTWHVPNPNNVLGSKAKGVGVGVGLGSGLKRSQLFCNLIIAHDKPQTITLKIA